MRDQTPELGHQPTLGSIDLWVRAIVCYGFLCPTCHLMITGQLATSQTEQEVICQGCQAHYVVSAIPSANFLTEGVRAIVQRA